MPQSLAKVYVHLVFSTKGRKPWLQKPSLRNELYRYMATILKTNVDSPPLLIGGVEDHVHALVLLSRNFPIKDVVRETKTETCKWLKRQDPLLTNFGWQNGYGVFSVSQSSLEQVQRYIANQEEHHRRQSFQNEFRELCRRHKIDWDERFLWD